MRRRGSDDCARGGDTSSSRSPCGSGCCDAPQRATVRRSTEPEACHQGRGGGWSTRRTTPHEDRRLHLRGSRRRLCLRWPSCRVRQQRSVTWLTGSLCSPRRRSVLSAWTDLLPLSPTGVEGGGREAERAGAEAGTGGGHSWQAWRKWLKKRRRKRKKQRKKVVPKSSSSRSCSSLSMSGCVPKSTSHLDFLGDTSSAMLRSTVDTIPTKIITDVNIKLIPKQ